MNNKILKAKNYIYLHICIIIYCIASVVAKYSARFDLLSLKYIICYIIVLFILGVYAIIWQQIIKMFPPSVAYSNKSVTIIWIMLFAFIFFNEEIFLNNIIGGALILLGVIMVTKND